MFDQNSSIWQDLFLDGASAPYLERLVPGCSPASRLVGVELNPGPPGKGRAAKRRQRGKAVAKLAVVSVPSRRRSQRKQPAANTVLSQFLQSAQNPFMHPAPALGYDSFGTTGIEAIWSRTIGMVPGSTSTCAAVVYNPSTVAPSTGMIGTSGAGYITVEGNGDPNNLLAGTSTTSRQGAVNALQFSTIADSYRVLTAAVRLTIRYPMTSAPGRLFALPIFESDTNLAASTYTGLAALGNTIPVISDGSGVAVVQCNWRQMDRTAFDFLNPLSIGAANDNLSKCIIIALGWPAGFTIDIETIAHVEYNSGAIPSSDSSDLNSVALTTSIERLGALIRRIPTVLSKSDLAACNLQALLQARNRNPPNRSVAPSGAASTMRASVTESIVTGLSTGAGEYYDVAAEAVRERAQEAASSFAFNSLAAGTAGMAAYIAGRQQARIGA